MNDRCKKNITRLKADKFFDKSFRKFSIFLFITSVVVSCAHKSKKSESEITGASALTSSNTTSSITGSEDESPVIKLQDLTSFHVGDADARDTSTTVSLLETVPVEVNPMVEKWIAYFQGKGRPHMERYLSRSSRYMALMKKILRQNGLPEDIIYIALIESGFASKITSRAAAVGYWQFIRGTGKRYGLEISSLVDERRDPVLSTQAAAEYFKGLYSVFGNWYLSMASYNVGENRVKKEMVKHMSRDFWELARKRSLPSETINYVPKFIAAKMIATDPKKYGFEDIDYLPPLEFDSIKVDKPVNLRNFAEAMNLEYDDIKQLNPKYKGEIAPVRAGILELKIPVGTQSLALAAFQKSTVDRVEFIADAGDTVGYKVRASDSLSTIAKKFKTTVAWLRDTNDLKKGRKLRVGQTLQVPDLNFKKKLVASAKAESAKSENLKSIAKNETSGTANGTTGSNTVAASGVASGAAANGAANEGQASANEIVTSKGIFYIVQPGDSLSEIANDYDSSVVELRKMNKLKRGVKLKVGMKIRVPKVERLPTDPNGDKADEESDSTDSNDNSGDTLNAEQRGGARRDSRYEFQKRSIERIQQSLPIHQLKSNNGRSVAQSSVNNQNKNNKSIVKNKLASKNANKITSHQSVKNLNKKNISTKVFKKKNLINKSKLIANQ